MVPSTACHGTLCTLSSSLVAPKVQLSTSSPGISPLRQQECLQISQLHHHHLPAQPHQHDTLLPRSQHLHRKSILVQRSPMRMNQTYGHQPATHSSACSPLRQMTTRPASGHVSAPATAACLCTRAMYA